MKKKYPTLEEVAKATPKVLRHWLMYLPSPLTEEEKEIIQKIKKKRK
jgi:hypothetical protein